MWWTPIARHTLRREFFIIALSSVPCRNWQYLKVWVHLGVVVYCVYIRLWPTVEATKMVKWVLKQCLTQINKFSVRWKHLQYISKVKPKWMVYLSYFFDLRFIHVTFFHDQGNEDNLKCLAVSSFKNEHLSFFWTTLSAVCSSLQAAVNWLKQNCLKHTQTCFH